MLHGLPDGRNLNKRPQILNILPRPVNNSRAQGGLHPLAGPLRPRWERCAIRLKRELASWPHPCFCLKIMTQAARTPGPALESLALQRARMRLLGSLDAASHFGSLLEHLPGISFFVKDHKLRLLFANRHFIESVGRRQPNEVLGHDDFSLFPPRLAENFRRDDLEVLRGNGPKLNIVELFFNAQGIPDWFVTNKLPLHSKRGAVIGVMGTTQALGQAMKDLHASQSVQRALDHIRRHFRQHLRVADLADAIGISARQLHRKFMEAFGCSPQTFITKLRVQAACEALQHADAQISAVATSLGFCDQSALTLHFHRHMGITPLHYQRRFRLRQQA